MRGREKTCDAKGSMFVGGGDFHDELHERERERERERDWGPQERNPYISSFRNNERPTQETVGIQKTTWIRVCVLLFSSPPSSSKHPESDRSIDRCLRIRDLYLHHHRHLEMLIL